MRPRIEQLVTTWSPLCTAEISVAILGGAWKPSILTLLNAHRVLRFGELSRHLGNCTARVLTRQLRELEIDGLVVRTVYAEVPPKVEYSLSALGEEVQPLIGELARWGTAYIQQERESNETDAESRAG